LNGLKEIEDEEKRKRTGTRVRITSALWLIRSVSGA